MTGDVVDAGAPVEGELRRGAYGLAVVTVLSRLAGFVRGLVFVRAVGATDVGDTYARANTVPNIVFDAVAGGALASSVVPVLAGPADRGDHEQTLRTTAALLTWTVLLLAPITVLGMLLARPLMELLTPAHVAGDRAQAVTVGARMLVVFAPQVVLYGVGVVLTGVLQAHRRFLGPALAPLLSSIVVSATYLVYAVQTHHQPPTLRTLTTTAELTLAVGTTAGVLVLSLSLVVPLRRLGVPLRVGLHFPPGVRSTAVRLALAGVATLAAQQLSLVVVLRLSYGGPAGTLVLYQLAWQVFLVPWAVLAVPLATSAFPHLVVRHGSGDQSGWATLTATTTRTVLVVSGLAAALLVAASSPLAHLLVLHARGVRSPSVLAGALAAFAPGLLGYGVVAHLGRALYATGEGRHAAAATVVGWIGVLAGDLALSTALSPARRLLALAWGNTAGLTLAGVLLVALLRRRDRAALHGVTTTAGVVLVAMLAGGATGWALRLALPGRTLASAVVSCVAVGLGVLVVYAGVVRLLDAPTAEALLGRRRHD